MPRIASPGSCKECQRPVSKTLKLQIAKKMLDFLGTWVAGDLGFGGLGLPQAPQSPCEFVSVGHVWTLISSSAFSVCSFLFFFTSINIFCFQQKRPLKHRVIMHENKARPPQVATSRRNPSSYSLQAADASLTATTELPHKFIH
jgi:hypothetical protein